MNAFKENTDADPPPYFLITDLDRVTFPLDGKSYSADDTSETGTLAWSTLVNQIATIKGDVDWTDLEDRAHFLNKLYAFCQTKNVTFPWTEVPENLTQEEEKY